MTSASSRLRNDHERRLSTISTVFFTNIALTKEGDDRSGQHRRVGEAASGAHGGGGAAPQEDRARSSPGTHRFSSAQGQTHIRWPIRTRRLLPQRRGRCRHADPRPALRRRLSPTPPRGVLPRRGLRVPHAWAQSDDSAHPRVRLWEGEGAALFCGGFLRSLKWLHGTEGKTGRGSNEF